MMAALYLAAGACLAVAGDRIVARDLAPAVEAFRALAPDTEVGYTPAPGSRRIFRTAELARLIRRFAGAPGAAGAFEKPGDLKEPDSVKKLDDAGVNAEPAEICVERDMETITLEALRAALIAAVGDPQATLEVAQWSRYPVPRGEIEFPRTGIAVTREPLALWRGYVKYGTNRRFAIWARVRVSVHASRLVARENLPAGNIIRPDQLRTETVERFPFGPRPAASLEEVAGRVPRRSIPAGEPVWATNLEVPLEIHAGDVVSVEVSSGQAQVAFDGRAAGSGHRGDVISVKNPANGKTLRARVDGPGKASINVAPALSVQGRVPVQGAK
jgi:flagella basal body P-ring formation protein FlgA